MTTPAGAVHVDVIPDFTGFAGRFAAGVRALTTDDHIEIKIDVDDAPVDRARRKVKDLDGDTKSLSQKFRAFNAITGLSAPKLIAFASSAGLAVQAISNLAAALAPASGIIIALPAIAGAGAVAMGTLKLALSGVGNAMKAGFSGDAKKFNESLKGLAPSAREAVRAIVGLKPQLDSLKKSVQGRFFAGMADEIQSLAKVYLPALQAGLPRVASSLSEFAQGFAEAARQGPLLKGVKDIIDATAVGLNRAKDAAGPLANALGILFSTGAGLARDMLGAVGSLGIQFGNFIAQAQKTGQLQAWLQGALDTLQTLGGLLVNIGSIVFSVFSAANTTGGSFLQTLTNLTGQFATFLNSARGASALQAIFGAVAAIGQQLGRVMGAVLPAIASAVLQLAPTIPPLVAALADILIAMVPLLPAVARLAVLFAQVLAGALQQALPLITLLVGWLVRAVDWIVRNQQVIVPLVAGILAMVTAVKIVNAALQAWRIIQLALNAVLFANPIGLVILVLVGLAAALVTAYKRSETFRAIVNAAWHAIQSAASTAWNNYIKPALTALIKFISKDVPHAFDVGQALVAAAWNKVKAAAAAPVNFVIGTVLNNGILKAWNFIADKFGMGNLKISPLPLIGGASTSAPRSTRGRAFADGGFYEGLLPGAPSNVDNLLATSKTGPVALATGEFIVNADSTSWALPILESINSNRRGFASGGLFGTLGKGLQKAFSAGKSIAEDGLTFLTDPAKWLKERLAGVVGSIAGKIGGGAFGQIFTALPGKLIDGMAAVAKKALGAIFGSGGPVSPGLAGALNFARAQVGAPYTWAAAGPKSVGYDCSGFMGAILNVIQGIMPPYRRRGATASFPWPGFAPGMGAFSIGSTKNTGGGIGHMAGTLNGVNVESRGGQGVVVGPSARGARDSLFGGNVWHLVGFARGGLFGRDQGDLPFDIFDRHGKDFLDPRVLAGMIFDDGGWLRPGHTLTYNGTGRPEAVFTDDQMKKIFGGARGGDGANISINYPPSIPPEQALADALRRHDMLYGT